MTLSGTLALDAAAHPLWDAVVIGAGPAGAVAAQQSAKLGLATLLIERQSFPRLKVCGGCLNGQAIAVLRSIGLEGVLADIAPVSIHRFVLHAANRSVELELPAGVAIDRAQFDAELVHSSIRAGAHFLPETTAVVIADANSCDELRTVQLTQHGGPERSVRGRVVIAADGLGHRSLQRLPQFACHVAPQSRVGLGITIENDSPCYREGAIYMAVARQGYVGLVRTARGRLNLAAAIDAGALRSAAGPEKAVAAVLAEAGLFDIANLSQQRWRGTPQLTQTSSRLAGSRVFVLGDAAGYVEPFTGEGMAWAIASAVSVIPQVVRNLVRWDEQSARAWERAQQRRARQNQIACRLLARMLRKPLAVNTAVSALAWLPSLARPFVRHLNAEPVGLEASVP